MTDIREMSDEELQAYKARLQAQRATGRGPDAAHFRYYRKTMLRKVRAELKRRGLPTRDGDMYGTAPHIAIKRQKMRSGTA
jgi:hypothetical protein